MRPVFSALLLAPFLAGCASFTARSDAFHYWNGAGLGWNDRYYAGVKLDDTRLNPEPPGSIGAGKTVLLGCDMAGCALLDTLCLPLDFYLNETDGQKRAEPFSEKGYY